MNPLLYLKAGAAAVVVAVLIWGGLVVNHWHKDSLSKAATEAQAARERADYAARLLLLQAQYAASQKASSRYQQALNEIHNHPVRTDPVRLCKPASVHHAAEGSVASGSSPASLPSGVVDRGDGENLEQGPDIGPDLREYAKAVARMSAQLQALLSLHASDANVP